MRALPLVAVTLTAALLAAGCARQEDPKLPSACNAATPVTVERALEAAPGEVTLEGTSLSECFTDNAEAADVQRIGGIYVAVAGKLAAEAQRDPDGPAATQLGYLVGATRRGAGGTQGIHDELRRRLEQELQSADSPAARAGEEAGLAGG